MNPINPQYAYQQMQQMFPQPQGSVYSINSAAEASAPTTSSPDNSMEERLARIEKLIEDKGGKFNGLL